MSKPKLYVMGDSISMHYGPYLKSYVSNHFAYARKGEFEEWGDINYVSKANGGDSSQMLQTLKELFEDGFAPDFLLLNCGLHDLRVNPETRKYQVPLVEYPENLEGIIKLCRQHVLKVIWVRTTPIDEIKHNSSVSDMYRYEADIETYNTAADQVMAEQNIPMIDLFGFTSSLDEDLFCDHAHFNEPVRKLQAAVIAGFLYGQL